MKKHLKSIALFLVFFFSPLIVNTNCENAGGSGAAGPESGAVSGHVFLEGSLKPIAGVVVSCADAVDTTQKSGRYFITNIPPGSRTITAVNSYYETFNTMVMIRADETTILDIFLRYDESIK